MRYEVTVGNIGTVHTGPSRKRADKVFRQYRDASRDGIGRGAEEPVTLFGDGELIMEYHPPCSESSPCAHCEGSL